MRTFDKVVRFKKLPDYLLKRRDLRRVLGSCTIISDRNEKIDAQVVGFRKHVVLLMALNSASDTPRL